MTYFINSLGAFLIENNKLFVTLKNKDLEYLVFVIFPRVKNTFN